MQGIICCRPAIYCRHTCYAAGVTQHNHQFGSTALPISTRSNHGQEYRNVGRGRHHGSLQPPWRTGREDRRLLDRRPVPSPSDRTDCRPLARHRQPDPCVLLPAGPHRHGRGAGGDRPGQLEGDPIPKFTRPPKCDPAKFPPAPGKEDVRQEAYDLRKGSVCEPEGREEIDPPTAESAKQSKSPQQGSR